MIKKLAAIICTAAAMLSWALTAFAETETKQVERDNPNSILILGDSIASGYGLDGYTPGDNKSCNNYGSLLAEKYGLTNETYRNYAIDGQTSEELLEKINSGLYDDYLGCEVIIISIGGNDLLGILLDNENGISASLDLSKLSTGETTLFELLNSEDVKNAINVISVLADERITAFSENLPKIIASLKGKSPDSQIVVQNLYNPMNTGIELIDSLYKEKIGKLNDVINSSENCAVADVYGKFSASEEKLIQNDFTHPNAEGHALIYSAVSECIDEKCVFYTTIEIERTTVEVQKPKSNLKKYVIALCVFGAIAILSLVIGIVLRIVKKRKQNKE